MTGRRFTDKPDLDPTSVRGLPAGHPALVENRTLFPSTVVDVDENFSERLLVSGANNRKLGKTIIKGRFQGYALYGLTLEERATCPVTCSVRGQCYGNGMPLARRHRITDLAQRPLGRSGVAEKIHRSEQEARALPKTQGSNQQADEGLSRRKTRGTPMTYKPSVNTNGFNGWHRHKRTAPSLSVVAAEPPPPPEPPRREEPPIVLEDGRHVTTLTVDKRMCRWPFGDPAEPEFHLCGHKAKDDSPYCIFHHRVAYQPQSTRRPKDEPEVEQARRALRGASYTKAFG